MNQSEKIHRFAQAAAGLGIVTFLAGLLLFAYVGTYSRFWADDYCYSATIKQLGLFNGLVDWYHTSGNRLSTLVVVAVADLFGWRSIQFTTTAVLALWVGAWVFFLFQLRRLFRWPAGRYWLVFLALVEVYFSALLAPDRLQTIYWRMGTFHYTLPAPLLLVNLGLLACAYRLLNKSRRMGWVWAWVLPLSALLGLFAAGLSETFAAMQAGALMLLALAAWVSLRGQQRVWAVSLLAAPLLGTLVMMAVMASAPANAWRQAVMPPPENPLQIVPVTLQFAVDFIFYTLRGQMLPFLVYIGLVGLAALVAVPPDETRLSMRGGLLGAVFALLAMYALVVCSFAPSAYAGLSYPAGRALMPGLFALLAGLGAAAIIVGISLRQVVLPVYQNRLAIAAVLMLAIACLYPLRAARAAQTDLARLSVTAGRWDARNAQILQSIADGNLNVQVSQVDVVQSLEDIGPNPKHWINACTTVFYGARSVIAKP